MLAELTADEKRAIEYVQTPAGWIQLLCEYNGEQVILDPFQETIVSTDDRFAAILKPRQVGLSFAYACRALSRAYLSPPNSYFAVILSYNLEDAREKMRYVDMLDSSLPSEVKMRRILDNKMEVEYVNHNRIMASFQPQGKAGEILIDEMTYMPEARTIYRKSVPITSRTGGAVFVGATPTAKSGQFYDIWTGAEGKFGDFRRVQVHWWESQALCRDLAAARVGNAAMLETAERVERFGSDTLRENFGNMFLEDFQTEYECRWSDESSAFLSWNLVEQCSPSGDAAVYRVDSIDDLRTLNEELYVGVDIGRRHNTTEIKVSAWLPALKRLEERLSVTLRDCPFDEQEAVLDKILSIASVKKMMIDQNGLGMMLTESLARKWGSRVVGVDISATTKPQIANNMRMMLEKGMYLFYPDRDTRQQFHSVKKVVSQHGNVVYDVDRNEKHHADKFWASALMLWGCAARLNVGKPWVVVFRSDIEPDRENAMLALGGVR